MNAFSDRKRQRRQAAGALVQGLFGGGGGSSVASPLPQPSQPVSTASAAAGLKKPSKKKSNAQPRPQIQIPARGIGPVYEPNPNDVLCGRGGRINAHSGNVQFRDIVTSKKIVYLAKETKKLEKAHIAAEIVQQIRRMEPSGRFLKEDSDGVWYDIGDAKAIKKVGQALREDAPDLRDGDGANSSGDEKQDVAENFAATKINKDDTAKQAPKHPVNGTKPSEKNFDTTEALATIQLPTQPKVQHSIASTDSTAIRFGGVGQVAHSSVVSGRGGKKNISPVRQVREGDERLDYEPIAFDPSAANSTSSYHQVVPPQPQQRKNYHNVLGMRGMWNPQQRRIIQDKVAGGNVVSGAALALLQEEENNEDTLQLPETDDVFDVPINREIQFKNRTSVSDIQSSLMSGMSGISGLTDPMSSLSGAAGEDPRWQQLQGQPRVNFNVRHQTTHMPQQQVAGQQPDSVVDDTFQQPQSYQQYWQQQQQLHATSQNQLQHLRQQWFLMQQQKQGQAVETQSSNGSGDDFEPIQINTSFTSAASPSGLSLRRSAFDDLTFAEHSLVGGGIRDDSVIGTNSMYSGLMRDDASFAANSLFSGMGSYFGNHSLAGSMAQRSIGQSHRSVSQQRVPKATASVTSMSIASGIESLPSIPGSIMSELSDNLMALDLAEPKMNQSYADFLGF